LRDMKTKNHQKDTDPSSEAVIYSTDDDNNPVRLLRNYISKLNEDVVYLWQKPNGKVIMADSDRWYIRQKVGINTVNSFMKSMSTHLQLSKMYTNHSVRSTAITLLGRSFQDNDIACFSGHKSLGALGIYKRVSDERKQEMSDKLNEHMQPTPVMESDDTAASSSALTSGHYELADDDLTLPILLIPEMPLLPSLTDDELTQAMQNREMQSLNSAGGIREEIATSSSAMTSGNHEPTADDFAAFLQMPEFKAFMETNDGGHATRNAPMMTYAVNHNCTVNMNFHIHKK
jgi:hypothetical protein